MQWIFSGWQIGDDLIKIINQGGCSVNYEEPLRKLQWTKQMRERKAYFYTFLYEKRKYITSIMQMKSSPYRSIFYRKISHMEENGLMEHMFLQLTPMRPMETEPLKPLKLTHFYLVFLGIFAGLILSMVAIGFEICICKKKQFGK